ncbi:hypothetical protein PRK78_001221 [Emydomyces testavorans]|uniref:Uncharacterized protein n=1 Tax=Emydomyces testavorans TaxID=2070801 RepID=A0AAF0DCJ8_9EURO|nr:hypothetical protein PRK78_001221 [Emydomyces testavorans]
MMDGASAIPRGDRIMKQKEDTTQEKDRYSYPSRETSFEHDEESYSFSDCSYSTSYSARPILKPSIRRGKHIIRPYRLPHSLMRCVCLGVFSALILFVFALFRVTLIHTFIKPIEIRLPEDELALRPHQWESFPFLARYYGGIRTLISKTNNVPEYPREEAEEKRENTKTPSSTTVTGEKRGPQNSSIIFDPYPNYTSPEYIQKYGSKQDCSLDTLGKVSIPHLHHYNGIPEGFPDPIIGSNELLGIEDNICFDRFGRLGPYGLGYGLNAGGSGAGLEGDRSGIEVIWENTPPVDFRHVNWADAQDRCISINQHRFPELPTPRTDRFRTLPIARGYKCEQSGRGEGPVNVTFGTSRLQRTAFIIRTWHDFQYNGETIMFLRSLISELSLMSGGEYMVHFLIHVKDDNLQIWSDDEVYDRILQNALPEEFQGMGTLWSERQMGLIYGGLEEKFVRNLPVHGVYRSTFMPLQYFAHQHPEYDFYWNWEMDIRYTGHWYHLLDKLSEWSKKQPRKGLWERSSRFYVPAVHGSWDDFRQLVRVQTETGTNRLPNIWSALKKDQQKGHQPEAFRGDKPIWGPERPTAEQDILKVDDEGIPPIKYEKDKYEWGVGEDADLIVLNPLYDPEGTTWLLKDDVTGYEKGSGHPPRRASIITASRLSRKLLQTMHRETSLKRHSMFSEMWPATVCLHHGFKAVYAPHSVYIDRLWPPAYLESIFNGGKNGASGGGRMSIFGDGEHNFRGTTWFYATGHAPNLWNRWLGYKVNNDGGEEFELANDGRMCLPPMLLHPVKEVNLIVESGGR